MGFEGGSGFDVTEMGTEKRLALWVVGDPEEVEGLATLGVDPLDAAFDVERLARLLADASGNVKTVLAAQSIIAGIGNAYSDEILHVAHLSPFKPARNLDRGEVERLHGAVVAVLAEAVARAVGQEASELKGEQETRHARARPDGRGVSGMRRRRTRGVIRHQVPAVLRHVPDGGQAPRRPAPVEAAALASIIPAKNKEST